MSIKSVLTDFENNADAKNNVMDKKEFIRKLLFDHSNQEQTLGVDKIFTSSQLELLKAKASSISESSANSSQTLSLNLILEVETLPDDYSQHAINLISFVDPFFDSLIGSSALSQDIKLQLNRLRVPFLILIAEKPKLLLDKNNFAKQFINDLLNVGLLWQENDARSQQILQQVAQTVAQLLNCCKDATNFVTSFNKTATQFNHFASSVVKRAEIFEKRVKEAENGQAKAQAAKILTSQALDEIMSKQGTPDFVSHMLSKAWQHVIFLEFLKSGEAKKNQSLFLAKALLSSCQPIHTFEETEKFLELQPHLIDSIRTGLEKSSYTFAETGAFIEELDNFHTQILNDVKIKLEKGPKEEILRLKPVENPFDNSAPSEPANNREEIHTDIESLTQNEWVEHIYGKLESQIPDSNITEDPDETRREKDQKASEKLFRLLQPGRWLNILNKGKTLRCKLALYVEASDKYVFVNGAGTKVAELTRDEITSAYQNQEVEVLQNTPLFERTFKSVLNELFEQHQQKVGTQANDERKESETVEASPAKVNSNEPAHKTEDSGSELESKEETVNTKSNLTSNDSNSKEETHSTLKFDLSQLSNMAVGSWVEIKIGYKMKKCRLAARVASTGKLIFTDRSGIKVKECLDTELVNLYQAGDLKIDEEHTLFDKAFSSVISNMRSLKSEKT